MRIGLKQILLLMAIVGLVAGLFAMLEYQKPATSYHSADVSPDGKYLAALGYRGWDLFDLERRERIALRRWPGLNFSFFANEANQIQFVDNDEFLYVNSSTLRDLVEARRYEIPDREDREIIVLNPGGFVVPLVIAGGKLVARTADLQQPPGSTNPIENSLTVFEPDGTKRKIDINGPIPATFLLSPDLNWYIEAPDPFSMTVTSSETAVTNLRTGERWPLFSDESARLIFSPDSRRLAVLLERELRVYELSTNDDPQTPDGPDENSFDDKTLAEIGPVNSGPWRFSWSRTDRYLDLDFDETGNRIALLDEMDGSVKIVDATTGKVIKTLKRYRGARLVAFVPGRNQLAIIPHSSDSPMQIRDIPSDAVVYRLGGENRFGTSIAYTALFFAWAFVWGFVARQDRRVNSRHRDTATTDPFQTVVDAELVASVNSSGMGNRAPPSLQAVWILMAVGGVFAIGWAVIPMFFIKNGMTANFAPFLLYFRYTMALYSLVVGLCALSTSASQSRARRWLTVVAILQMVNIITLDILNAGLAIAELIMLSQTETKQATMRQHHEFRR